MLRKNKKLRNGRKNETPNEFFFIINFVKHEFGEIS